MPNKEPTFFHKLMAKESNIWVTVVMVLLILWAIVSLIIIDQTSEFGLSYNTSSACTYIPAQRGMGSMSGKYVGACGISSPGTNSAPRMMFTY